jgi:ABC-type sugar transport system ATPase subunit
MKSQEIGLQLKGVGKAFGTVRVVQGLDLDVFQGEFVVRLDDVSEGRIFIKGQDVTDIAPKARDIAMVFQNYALYPHMDVAHNMSFALELAGVSKAEITRRVNEAAAVLNITHLLQRKPKELSGGQRQRVAIGRCIVREPAVFLFEEPLSNLDAKLRAHMRTELALLHERLGKTTIYVTHDQVEAMTLASRIVIFDKGHIQQVGTPSEVFNRPANLFVAGFIGMPSMNLLEGQVQVQDGQARLVGPGFAFPLSDARLQGQSLIAGVRPQTLQLTTGQPVLQLQVDVVEYLGMESLLVGKLVGAGDGRVTAVVPGQRADLMRQTVGLEMDPQALHVFDKTSGMRIPV